MNILALGLNHTTAPIALRERAAFAPDALAPALRDLTGAGIVSEAAILSTCNRTEIYCGDDRHDQHDQHRRDDTQPLLDWFSRHTGLKDADLATSVYRWPNEHAVKHAFRVASGLDSMVLGEAQILGQMKHAYQCAAAAGATGKVLNRLFQHSFSVAKQVRTDTAVGANSVSVAYAGVGLAKRVFADLGEQKVLLIGAGETVELTARHLADAGVARMTIANRTRARADALAAAVGGGAITFAQIPDRLHDADIVVTATASTLPILGKGAVERALVRRRRRHKPMFILDLAMPRDVEAEVGALHNVYLYTVDDLQSVVAHNRDLRERAAADAERIIDLQVMRFMRWMRALESVPVVRALRDQLAVVGDEEVARALKRIQHGDDPAAVLRQLARNLTNKIAHRPSRALRQAEVDGDATLADAARKLFGL